MEIADLSLISDFEAGIKHLKNNPSLISNLSSLTKLPQLHSFWTYGALLLTIFATFTNLFNTIKTFIHQTLIKPLLSYRNSYPQHIFNNNVDSDFDFDFDFSSDDDDLDTPSSVADSDDEEDEHSDDNCRTDEVFLFRAEGDGDGGYWNNNNNEGQNGNFTSFNNLSLRRRNGRTDEVFRYWKDSEGQNGNFSNINNLTLRRRNGRVDEVFRVEDGDGGGYWNNNNDGQNGNFTSFNNLTMRRRNGRVDEVFRVEGWNNNNNNNEGQNGNFNSFNNLSLRWLNGCSLSEFFAGKSVVKLWDLDRVTAETVVLTAEVDGVNGDVGFGTYDSLVHEMSPAIYATWRPRQRKKIWFEGDGVAGQKEE